MPPRSKAKEARELQALRDRVFALGSELVRYDAPNGWDDAVIDAAKLEAASTDAEVIEAVTAWAQERGCYCDPDATEDDS